MDPFDPILDQPQVINTDEIHSAASYRLANHDLCFNVDAATDLNDLYWPWADAIYARSIRIKVADAQDGELMALVTREYPGYQESILGSEGVIISKRLAAPLGSGYDRAVLWMFDCQAEGDRLLRLDIEIDWGEPLTQRMVDGLLVAQLNPGRAQGIYGQQNADSTRVFGNPHGRPSVAELDEEGRAHLVYYVLVNGMVEVPLVLTISDVGEQIAWNGFLALRDAERAFELSVGAWEKVIKTGRLWTSDPQLNRAVQTGRLAAARHLARLRTGIAPSTRRVEDAPALVKSLDAFDLVQSRNLLAHLRRVAERSNGKLPELLPLHPKEAPADPGPAIVQTNGAYLAALHDHLQRHPDAELLAEHYIAVQACAEALVQLHWQHASPVAPVLVSTGAGLRHALALATLHNDSANVARWESEVSNLERQTGALDAEMGSLVQDDWQTRTGWMLCADRPWTFADPYLGIAFAGDAIWCACALQWQDGDLWVYPTRCAPWRWWALLDLPQTGTEVAFSLVWDGETLHTTRPVQSDQPVAQWRRIRALRTDELDFDLQFEMTPTTNADGATDRPRHIFHPQFDAR
jgi:hypothetical protein